MASTPDLSVTDSIRDDFLTCHICFEVFTDSRILPCLHTYCFQCICSHVDTAQAEGRPVVCPECREPIADKVASLKTNFFINGLSDVVKEKSTEEMSCTACMFREQESKAKMKCLDCGDYLCSSCADGHNASSLTWKHEKISLGDIKQGTYDEKLRQLQKVKCSKHEDKDVEFYCVTCCGSICLTCVVLDHKDHTCKTIPEAVSDKKSNMIRLTNELQQTLLVFVDQENKVKSSIKALIEADKKERLSIEKQAEKEIAKINANKKVAIENVTRTTNVKQKEFDERIQTLRLQKSLLNSSVNFSDEILKRGKDEEILMLEPTIMDRLMHIRKVQEMEEGVTIKVTSTSELVQNQQLHQIPSKSVKLDDIHEVGASLKSIGGSNPKDLSCTTTAENSAKSIPKKDEERTQKRSKGVTERKTEVKLIKKKTFSVKFATDAKSPLIKDMTYNSKIGLILADERNSKIKILNTAGKSKLEIRTNEFHPCAVAVAGDVIGAISDNYFLLFTFQGSLRNKVKVTEQKPNKAFHFNYCLAASEENGFILGNIWGDNKLKVYDNNGNLTRNLDFSISLPLAGLSMTHSGDMVLSEWGSGSMRVISPEGRKRFTVKESKWKPNGTCSSRDGAIFVAEYYWRGVGVYSSTGDHILDFSTASDGVQNPISVAVDENDVLYVTDNTGKVCAYEFHLIVQ